jgi:UDP-N-acetyl-2-amino-2-deoxyglucuronate dehydrogenase
MTLHVGLIGGGNISETHARAATAIPGVEVSAVYGTNAEKIRQLCGTYGGTAYDEFDEFLNHKPMDMVVIGGPSGLHAAQGAAAARRGIHVLTEKPIDISTERADQLISAAKDSSVKLGVIFQDRFKPDICLLKRHIEDGAIGKPLIIDASVRWYRPPEYYSGSKWRGTLALDGGGALINQAVHTVDLLLWLFGDVHRVQAKLATTLHAIKGEDTAVALLEFANGATGTLLATTAAFPGYPRRIAVSGTNGTIILEHDRIVAADLRDSVRGLSVKLSPKEVENAGSPVVTDFSGHQAVLEDFIRAIQENGTPRIDGCEGRRSIALIEEIYRAAGRKVI